MNNNEFEKKNENVSEEAEVENKALTSEPDTDNDESTAVKEDISENEVSGEIYSDNESNNNEDVIIPAESLFEETVSPEPEQNYAAFAGGQSYTSGDAKGYEWNGSESEKTKQKKKKKKSDSGNGLRVFTGILLTVFVLSFVSLTAMVASIVFDNYDSEKKSDNKSQNNYTADANVQDYVATVSPSFNSEYGLTISQIAAKCSPSAVGILSEVETSYNFGFFSQSGTATSVGSGFIFSNDGFVITNHHVIDDAKKITVVLHDKTELEAELIGSDSISDIAVIKIKDKKDATLIPMEIGNSDNLVVGEPVVAIGCPAGIEYLGTVTDGIISAINRDIEITDSYGRTKKTMTLIQTNATINKGNSGGPLINNRGQVIGINTLKLTSEFEGIGFSIPMNGAMAIINQLIEHGEVIERTEEDFAYGKGQIGIQGQAITAEEAEHYGIPEGVLVYQIDKTSSAAKAGLRRGDIITKYNGKEVKTVQDINDLKAENRAGETVTVTVYRDSEDGKGKTLDISFKLDAAS